MNFTSQQAFKMEFSNPHIKDCKVIICDRHFDDRGFFQELFEGNKYNETEREKWKQVNWSHSLPNVLRGIHYANYSKLVTCLTGRIWDVVVDLRPDSMTYMSWFAQELSRENQKQIYVPAGCGHGFYAYEESNVVYLQTGLYAVDGEKTIRFDDPELGVRWPSFDAIISQRDLNAGSFKDFLK